MGSRTKAYAVAGLLGAAAGAMVVLFIARRLPDAMSRMMTGIMKGTQSGTIPDI